MDTTSRVNMTQAATRRLSIPYLLNPTSPQHTSYQDFKKVAAQEPAYENSSTMMLLPLRSSTNDEIGGAVKEFEKFRADSTSPANELEQLFEYAESHLIEGIPSIDSFYRYRARALKTPIPTYFNEEEVAEQFRKTVQTAKDSEVFHLVDWDKADTPQVVLMKEFFNALFQPHEESLSKMPNSYRETVNMVLTQEFLRSNPFDLTQQVFDLVISLIIGAVSHQCNCTEAEKFVAAPVETLPTAEKEKSAFAVDENVKKDSPNTCNLAHRPAPPSPVRSPKRISARKLPYTRPITRSDEARRNSNSSAGSKSKWNHPALETV